MEKELLNSCFKSMAEHERASVVVCDLEHTICYMNPAAIRNYAKWGGAALVGKNLLNCHNADSKEMIDRVVKWFLEDNANNMIYTAHNPKQNKDIYMVALRDDAGQLIGYYEKHEYRDPEGAAKYDFSQSLV